MFTKSGCDQEEEVEDLRVSVDVQVDEDDID